MSGVQPPLSGVRVVEISEGLALPFGARLLGDAGADVVKVESDAGDRTRSTAPFYVTDDGEERSALFEYLNFNKRGVTLDPVSDAGVLADLIGDAQILLVGDDARLWTRWGLDPETLRAERPDLVIVSLTPFGLMGPKADWCGTDLVIQAASGLMSFSGTAGRPPLKRGLRQSTYETGLNAAYTALAGLFTARRGDGGVFVDISMVECITSELVLQVPEYTYVGAVATRKPPVLDPFAGDPVRVESGYLTVQINPMIPVSAFADFLDAPRLADERFQTGEGRAVNADALVAALRDALRGVDPRDFFQRSAARGLLTGVSQTAGQLLECSQLNARQAFVKMPGMLNGKPWKMPLTAAVFQGTPVEYRTAAPELAVDGAELVPGRGVPA